MIEWTYKAFEAVGTPSTWIFKSSIQSNLIEDNKVAKEDANLAENFYSSNARSTKEKFAHLKLAPVTGSITEIPGKVINANEELKLSINELFTHGLVL